MTTDPEALNLLAEGADLMIDMHDFNTRLVGDIRTLQWLLAERDHELTRLRAMVARMGECR